MWTVRWQPVIGQVIHDPTICYLALMLMEMDGSFKDPKDSTGHVARLEYCMQLMFLVKMMLIARKI